MTNDGEVKSEKQGEDKAQAGLGKQCAGQQGAATCIYGPFMLDKLMQ
jgi:hypothetical protein